MIQARTLIAMERVLDEGLWDEIKGAGRAIGSATKDVALGTFDPRRVPDDPKNPNPDRPLRPSLLTGFYRGLKSSGALGGKVGIRIKSPEPKKQATPTTKAFVPQGSGGSYAKRQKAIALHRKVVGTHPPDNATSTEIHARVLQHIRVTPKQPRQ